MMILIGSAIAFSAGFVLATVIDIETVILKLEEGIKRREVERGRYGI